MLIHTNEITPRTIHRAAHYASRFGAAGMVDAHEVSDEMGSRTHERKYKVQISGDGTVTRRRVNPGAGGYRGGDLNFAATYDQWGLFLAYLYAVDANAKAGQYLNAEDFAEKTHGAYPLPTVEVFA